jgi:hypothetical protein
MLTRLRSAGAMILGKRSLRTIPGGAILAP